MPHGDLTAAGGEQIQQVVRDVWPGSPDAVRRRARGARFLLEHLAGFPGPAWQQRWEASGLNERGRPVTAVRGKQTERDEICVGTACLFSLRVIQPSLQALRSTRFLRYGERFLIAQHDPLLEEFWKRVQDSAVHPLHHGSALFDATAALTTQGIALADLTPEVFLHYVWESRDHGLAFKGRSETGRGQFPGQLAWQVLHDMGHFPAGTPATLRAAVLSGRRTIEELVDRYDIRHQGLRQLLLDYLRRREPEMDYSTLDQLSRSLAGLFWAKIVALAPGQPDLRIDADLYRRWREALGTHQDGRKQREEFEHILRSVRSFYTDLHSWAVEEPDKWAPWVAPCPVPDGALRGVIVRQRRRKERMDDRVRQRQPLLPVLVAHLEDRYHHLQALLQAASPLAGGETVTVNGQVYQRVWTSADDRRARRGGQANTRVRALATGKDINATTAEDLAFWEFAAVEVLRHAGIRIEELLELTHLSIRQYQRPNGEVIALLVIAPSKTDRERVIPMSAELFAVIAAIIRRHTRQGRVIPLIQRYDNHERRMSDPMPFLFQRHTGAVPRVISSATVLVMLRRRCAELAEQHPGFRATSFTPHDFRRLLATDLMNNGLPIHIGAALLGHLNLQTTRGYVAVFNEDVVRHYQEFLDRRREARSMDEYKPVTASEWSEFEEHFDRRKVELGGCTRPYGSACQHEHSCLRCPMLAINPKMLPRLDEIEQDLLARRARAENEVWLGEVEGIDLTLTFLRQKREETNRLTRIAPVELGIPSSQRRDDPEFPAEPDEHLLRASVDVCRQATGPFDGESALHKALGWPSACCQSRAPGQPLRGRVISDVARYALATCSRWRHMRACSYPKHGRSHSPRWKPGSMTTAVLEYFTSDEATILVVLTPDAAQPVVVELSAEDRPLAREGLLDRVTRLIVDVQGLPLGWDSHAERARYERVLRLPPHVNAAKRSGPVLQLKLANPAFAYRTDYLDELGPVLLPASIRSLLESCDVLCLVPHGPLHSIPFASLPWEGPLRVADRFGLCQVPSVGLVPLLQDRNPVRGERGRHRSCLVAAVAAREDPDPADFEADAQVLDQVMKQAHGSATCFVGATAPTAATKAAVLGAAPAHDVVHLACHGVFAESADDPMSASGVLLAAGGEPPPLTSFTRPDGVPAEAGEHLLSAREVLGLGLAAELVTLRACSSGRSTVTSGDELLGLVRAFLHAGTPSLIVSLWNVNKASSRLLLEHFYRAWLGDEPMPKWRALQLAQQALREWPEYDHPFHWAPFMLVGDWV